MKITKVGSNDCGGFRPPKGHLDTQMFPECAGTETDRDIVKKTRKRRNKNHRNVHAAIIPKDFYCVKCGVMMGTMTEERWNIKDQICDACAGRLVKAPIPPTPITPIASTSIYKSAQNQESMGDVLELKSEEEKMVSDMLSKITDKALEGNIEQQQFLSNLWNGESWDSIKSKVLAEGSTWYVWWMDGVRKFKSQMDTKDIKIHDSGIDDLDAFAHGIQPDSSSASNVDYIKRTAGRENKDKCERCVMDIKKKKSSSTFNLIKYTQTSITGS